MRPSMKKGHWIAKSKFPTVERCVGEIERVIPVVCAAVWTSKLSVVRYGPRSIRPELNSTRPIVLFGRRQFGGAPPNHDDKADAQIEVRLRGWGIQNHHEVSNSFFWSPDGWLYGGQGFATRSHVAVVARLGARERADYAESPSRLAPEPAASGRHHRNRSARRFDQRRAAAKFFAQICVPPCAAETSATSWWCS